MECLLLLSVTLAIVIFVIAVFKKNSLFRSKSKPISTRLCSAEEHLKSFDEVPSLKSYPLIGHSYLFFPNGKYKADRLTEAVQDISKQLGPIFRLKLGGSDMVVTVNADHAQSLFKNEGTRPIRPPFAALAHYRQKTFNSVGVVPGNGEEWYKFRKGVTPLMNLALTKEYKSKQLEVAKTFVKYIEKHRDEEDILHDIHKHLFKFAIEAISVVSPGRRFHCLTGENLETETIIKASVDFMDGLHATLMGPPLWKIFKTAGYKKLETSHNIVYSILKKHFEDNQTQYLADPEEFKTEQPYLYALFSLEHLTWDDKMMLAMEIFLGGIDSTATTIAFALHYLSRNKELQKEAKEQQHCQLPDDSVFFKACVKETLRLSPTGGANARFLVRDTVVGEYLVPEGTLLLVFNSVISRNEEYFRNAQEFCPQRWLVDSNYDIDHHKFASLPFGHGPRMCPGKRLAENEIAILLKEILQSYDLEPTDPDPVGMVYRMNRIPDRPINIKFVNSTNH